mmetsp:Transcript_27393/g.59840  ORF Transcript_27393/g.59840 Transcript_27393/m.59840 type:complete len:283 (+) Transcript_27393:160-1008(+)
MASSSACNSRFSASKASPRARERRSSSSHRRWLAGGPRASSEALLSPLLSPLLSTELALARLEDVPAPPEPDAGLRVAGMAAEDAREPARPRSRRCPGPGRVRSARARGRPDWLLTPEGVAERLLPTRGVPARRVADVGLERRPGIVLEALASGTANSAAEAPLGLSGTSGTRGPTCSVAGCCRDCCCCSCSCCSCCDCCSCCRACCCRCCGCDCCRGCSCRGCDCGCGGCTQQRRSVPSSRSSSRLAALGSKMMAGAFSSESPAAASGEAVPSGQGQDSKS